LVSTVAGINNLSFEEQRQKYADLINSGAITDTMLGALGENAYNVVNSKSEEDLRAFTNKL
jgi:hypothetical protein